ncbi:MAG TPA: preprotein translocase subunit SecG [Pyrinomonadaceae bacterium]|nr:preprotein translocase subunit SecG [Pyrinomonadaceae bacterium]
MIAYIFYGLFILACVILIVTILLQPGKSDAGALFSSSVSSTAFGPRGTASLLAKITIGSAAAFFLLALCLSLPAITGTSSVLQSGLPVQAPQPSPVATPQASPSPSALPAAVPLSTVLTPSPKPTKK